MEKILIIDDDRLIRRVIKDTLIRTGYDVLEAESGEQGLALVKN